MILVLSEGTFKSTLFHIFSQLLVFQSHDTIKICFAGEINGSLNEPQAFPRYDLLEKIVIIALKLRKTSHRISNLLQRGRFLRKGTS